MEYTVYMVLILTFIMPWESIHIKLLHTFLPHFCVTTLSGVFKKKILRRIAIDDC